MSRLSVFALAFSSSVTFSSLAIAQTQPGSPATQPAPAPVAPATQPPPQAPPAAAPAAQPPPPAYPPPAAYPPAPAPYPPAYPPAYPAPPPAPPEYLPYEQGQAIPQGYVKETSVRKGPVIAGSIVLGVPYVIGLSAAKDLEEERVWLIVPMAGPWLTLATGDYSCDTVSTDCEATHAQRTLLMLDGFMQTAGGILLIYGIASPRERLVRQDLYKGLVVTPTFSASGAGLVASGNF